MKVDKTTTRYFVVAVKAGLDSLTDNGEYSEQEAWEFVRQDIEGHLSRFNPHNSRNVPDLSWDGWEEETP